MMEAIIVAIVIFAIVFLVVQLSLFTYRSIRYPDRGKIKKRLQDFSSDQYEVSITDIRKKRILSKIPFVNKLLSGAAGVNRFERLVAQSGSNYPVGFFLLLTAVLALSGYTAGLLIWKIQLFALLLTGLLACVPIFYLVLKKNKRMARFEAQLPEALDLIARALRSGHAFGSGMKMVAEEFGAPLGPEFRETMEEIQYGASTEDALKSLVRRVDCPDLKYFVISVILQRETGGNLADIIESIGHIIRERFKLQGKIRILTAESRFSALILILLPFIAVIGMQFMNPDYISTLLSTELGRTSIGIALGMMFIGVLVMKRMIKIRV
jgi:tight adherence protein B